MTIAGSCGSEELANELLVALTAGTGLALTPVDVSGAEYQLPADPIGHDTEVPKLETTDLTIGVVNGTGVFDALMASMGAHLRNEFEKNRITGEQYTKAYIELTSTVLATSVQFLLGKDQAYWQSVTAKLAAQMAETQLIESRVKLAVAKTQLQLINYEARTAEANYGLTKMKLSTESVGYCTAKFSLSDLMPLQKQVLAEQVEQTRAQTLNTRTDGAPVAGVVGKQRDLYDQQITSYQRDAENKVAKIFSDAWVTMKTLDEGLIPPSAFTNVVFDEVFTTLKTNVGLTAP